MTPQEKLSKIKAILCNEEKVERDGGEYLVCHHTTLYLDKIIFAVQADKEVQAWAKTALQQVLQVLNTLDEPEVHLGDRFPHITIQEHHQ